MSSKVILFCVLFISLEFIVCDCFSEEKVRQTAHQPINWLGNQNTPQRSRSQGGNFLQTQNINSNPPRRYGIGEQYNTRRESPPYENYGLNNQQLPQPSLSMKKSLPNFHPVINEREGNSYTLPREIYLIKTDNQHIKAANQQYRKLNKPIHNSFASASSGSRNRYINNKKPVIPVQQSYHIPGRQLQHLPSANYQNLNDDTLYPTILDRRYRPESDIKLVKKDNNRYLENTSPYSGALPNYNRPHVNLENKNTDYIKENRYAETLQNNPRFNEPRRNKVPIKLKSLDNSENSKFLNHSFIRVGNKNDIPNTDRSVENPVINTEYSNQDMSRNNITKLPISPSAGGKISIRNNILTDTYNGIPSASLDIADKGQNPPSGSVAEKEAFENLYQKFSPSNRDTLKVLFDNPKVKKLLSSHNHRFVIIHQNNTVEYLDNIEPIININPVNPVTENEDITTINYYTEIPLLVPNSTISNPMTKNGQSIQNPGYNPQQKLYDNHVYPSSASEFLEENDYEPQTFTSNIGTYNKDNYYPNNENNPTTTPSNLLHKSTTPGSEEKPTTELSDLLSNKTDNDVTSMPLEPRNHHTLSSPIDNKDDYIPIHESQDLLTSTTVNPENDLMSEFHNSLIELLTSLSTSTQPPKASSEDDETRTPAPLTSETSTSASSVVTFPPTETTVIDEIITISPIEIVTDHVKKNNFDELFNETSTLPPITDVTSSIIFDENSIKSIENNTEHNNNAISRVKDIEAHYNKSVPANSNDNSTILMEPNKESDENDGINSANLNDLKVILDIPNDTAGTLKITVKALENTGDTAVDETLEIHVDTKGNSDSESTNKLNSTTDSIKHQNTYKEIDKENNSLFDIINSGVILNKTIDKAFMNQLSSENSTVNLWYLIQMQPHYQPTIEKNKVTTIFPNGTIVEEMTETILSSKDDPAATVRKTTKFTHKDTDAH